MAELPEERLDLRRRLGVERLKELFDLARDRSRLLMPEHSKVAGELVRDGLGLGACRLIQAVGGSSSRRAFEEIQALAGCGEIALPELCQQGIDLGICIWILAHGKV